jgi:transposase
MKQMMVKKKNILVEKSTIKYNQRMMIKLLVAGMKLEDIAERLNVSTSRCKRWLQREDVMKALEEKTQEFATEDSKKRKKRLDFISSELYEALLEKVAKGHLKRMGSKNLMKFQLEYEKESRSQNPPSTQRVDVSVKFGIEELVQKYKNSNSLNYETKGERVIDITPPKQLEAPKEEGEKDG